MTDTDKAMQSIVEMCDGNPGAAVAIREFFTDENCSQYINKLRELNITGWKIWVCYKDICKQDIEDFKKKILDSSILEELKATRQYQLQADN